MNFNFGQGWPGWGQSNPAPPLGARGVLGCGVEEERHWALQLGGMIMASS